MSVTLAQRAQAYEAAFGPRCTSAVWVAGGGRWLYGHWEIGAHYRNATRFYGAYPPTFLERVMALFFEIRESQVPHAFSGSLPPGDYLRLDMRGELQPDIVGNVYDARRILRRYRRRIRLVIADPPYSEADAEKYFTPMVDRRRAIAAVAAAIETHSRLRFSRGTVFVVLARLEAKRYVASTFSEPLPVRGGKRTRLFKVTASGRREVQRATKAIARLVGAERFV